MRIQSINFNRAISQYNYAQNQVKAENKVTFKANPIVEAIVEDAAKGIPSANVCWPLNWSTENILKALKRNSIVHSFGAIDKNTFGIGFFEEIFKTPISAVNFTLDDAKNHFKNPNLKCGDILGYGWALGNMKEYSFWHGYFNKALSQMLDKVDPAFFGVIERRDIRPEEAVLNRSKIHPDLVKLIDANYAPINEVLGKLGMRLEYGIYDLGKGTKSVCREWFSVRLIDNNTNKQISGASSTPDSTFEVTKNGCRIEGALYAWAKLFDWTLGGLIGKLPKKAFNPMMSYQFK